MRSFYFFLFLTRGAHIISDEVKVNSYDCDLCKCVDRFWPNCTGVCESVAQKAKDKLAITTLESILNEIGSTCQLFGDLDSAEFCHSTTPDRDGIVFQSPATSLEGYNVVRAQIYQQNLMLRGCTAKNGEGYVTLASDYAPSPYFCPIVEIPPGRIIQKDLQVNKDYLIVPIQPLASPRTIINASRSDSPDYYDNLDSLKAYQVQFVNSEDSAGCSPSSIVLKRSFKGYINGRNYKVFRGSDKIRADTNNENRIYHTPWTGSVGQKPQNPIFDDAKFKGAPGFDHINCGEPETTTTQDETEVANSSDGPKITVTPINPGANPLDMLVQKCESWEFPEESFKKQDQTDKIYTEVAEIADGPFKANNITKFISIGGIRVVGEKGVDDKKVRHVGHTLAKILDHDQDGKFDHPEMIKELLQYHPILFIMESADAIMELMNAQVAEEGGFPLELKFCPFAFDFEEANKIVPGGKLGDATCEIGEDKKNDFDRSIPFVLDHLVGRGFNKAFSEEEKAELAKIYESSVEAGTFDPDSTGCPPDSEDCGKVMFASWALSSLNGFDKCWCEQTEALKFCDPDTLKNGEPELAKLLEKRFNGLSKLAEGDYSPKNKKIIVSK